MTEQNDSLNDKTRLINIALNFTGGDMDKARAMASGQYQDIISVKGKFLVRDTEKSGMFFAFFNTAEEYIANIDSVIMNTAEPFEDIRIFDDWNILYRDFLEFKNREDSDDSNDFNDFLMDSFISNDVFPWVSERNIDEFTRASQDIITRGFSSGSVTLQVEMEPTSSLNLYGAGIDIDVPGLNQEAESQEEEREKEPEVDPRVQKIESEADYIIDGRTIVSPVSGKFINDIKIGEKIKVHLPGDDVLSSKVLKAHDAIDSEGKKSPVNGRIKAMIPMEKGGSLIYALVAKKVLARIVEEENVKILVHNPDSENQGREGYENRLFYLVAILVGFLILAGIILFQLL